jgi:hypothetical protein
MLKNSLYDRNQPVPTFYFVLYYVILTALSERLHMEMFCENMNWIKEA